MTVLCGKSRAYQMNSRGRSIQLQNPSYLLLLTARQVSCVALQPPVVDGSQYTQVEISSALFKPPCFLSHSLCVKLHWKFSFLANPSHLSKSFCSKDPYVETHFKKEGFFKGCFVWDCGYQRRSSIVSHPEICFDSTFWPSGFLEADLIQVYYNSD